MRLYVTAEGIARAEGEDEMAVLDLAHPDLMSVLADSDVELGSAPVRHRLPVEEADLLPPVSPSAKLILVGANYRSHIEETGLTTPSRVGGIEIPRGAAGPPFAPIVLPAEAPNEVDYEGEIAVIIGIAGRSIAPGSGWDHIAGVCAANDVSARDVQLAGMQDGRVVDMSAIIKGKSFPTFKPLGPCLLTADELRERDPLELITRVNGVERQRGSTADMIFNFGQIVEGISETMDLEVGDVILTGTPAGVGVVDRRFLEAGDVVEVRVDHIGTVRNTVVSS
jgi:2-keto-4-pentenoate hydratase/2-oxohepta-3-ene-1,7-dioic acid hydratase in catechol pathway